MKIKKQSSLPSKYWLLILAAVCVLLLGVGRYTDGSGPLRFIANYTIIPMQKGISYIGMWMNDVSSNFETLSEMRKENEELQAKVDEFPAEKKLGYIHVNEVSGAMELHPDVRLNLLEMEISRKFMRDNMDIYHGYLKKQEKRKEDVREIKNLYIDVTKKN
jgi:hypothetical protein